MTALVVLVLRLLVASALYAFLGFALWMMWQELRRASTSAAGERVTPLHLAIKTRNQQQSEARLFMQTEVIIGRDPSSDVSLSDKAVSARHARLGFHHGQWWVDDLSSSNGTRLNGEQLRTSTVLTNGDEIKCGSARVLVSLPSAGGGSELSQGGQDE